MTAKAESLSPRDLWVKAGGGTDRYSRRAYLDLMREHGHVLRPGDEGHEEGRRDLPCGRVPGTEGEQP
jgi:hypothetical protein